MKPEEKVYNIQLEKFNGPFDLLWYLISRKQMSLENLDLISLTNQYVAFVESVANSSTINEKQLSDLTDYLVIAAKLLAIKTRLVMKNVFGIEEESIEEKNIIDMLMEYKKIKNAAVDLAEIKDFASGYITKEKNDTKFLRESPDQPIYNNSLDPYLLYDAFLGIADRINYYVPLNTTITKNEITQEEINLRVTLYFKKHKKSNEICLWDLLQSFAFSKMWFVGCFLAVLNLIFNQKVIIIRGNVAKDIYLKYKYN